MNINTIDSKILKELLKDGRKSFIDIATECGVTKNIIWKRYKTMEKKGIITGATIQMNFASFGCEALATLLISVEAQQIDNAMEYIGKITEVRAYRQYNSIYNIRAVTTLKNLKELDQVKGAIRLHLPMIGLKTYIWTDVKNIPENLKLTSSTQEEKGNNTHSLQAPAHPHTEGNKIDELDLRIVEKLASDGQAPFSEIAQKVGTSTDTVVKRYHKLKNSNAIKVSVQIDPNKIGYHAILDFNLSFTSSGNLSEIIESLAKIPDIIIITKTSGDYDLQVTAMIRDVDQMFTIQDEISRTTGVTKIEGSMRKIPTRWPTALQYISTF